MEQVVGWLVDLAPALVDWLANLVPAIVIALVTAWAYSRRETDRLVKVWQREHRKETLDSVKRDIRLFNECVVAVSVLQEAFEEGEVEPEQLWEVFLDSHRALASALATSAGIGDKQLILEVAALQKSARLLHEEWDEQVAGKLVADVGLVLRRCDELLEQMGKSKSRWKRIEGAK